MRCPFAFLLMTACCTAIAIEPIHVDGELNLGPPIERNENEWPCWRGAYQDGKSREANLPVEWTETDNVLRHTPIPGRGHSSPIVSDESIFLTTADEEATKQMVVCLERADGKHRWTKTVHQGGFMKAHRKNSQASSTPAWDGNHLYTVFLNDGALWVSAIGADGEIVWQRDVGPFRPEHGYGASPTLYRSLLIVNGDNKGENTNDSFIAAVDRETGKIVWRTPRERISHHGNYGSPIVATIAGKQQLLLAGHGKISSYNPATGGLIWSCEGPADVAAYSVAFGDSMVFAVGGYPERNMVAIRADGRGDVSETKHVVWRRRNGIEFAPSPIFHRGQLYFVDDDGIAFCLDGETGDLVWRKRLGGDVSSSLVYADGLLYASNEQGTTFVFNASAPFEMIAKNKLGNSFLATPTICGGRIFLRTDKELFCVGK